jgi:23S rRNA pseudoU1915 N3-methylase RlmH
MIKIFIISDSYQHFDKSIQEYQKRLSTNIELIKIKPVKLGDIVSKETDLIIKYLDKQK